MRRRRVAVASAFGLIALCSGPGASSAQQATFATATFAPQRVKMKDLTAARQMTKDQPAPTRAFGGPTSMLVDPENPRVVVAATADLRTRLCQMVVSTDAGYTWHFSRTPPGPEDYPFCQQGSAGVAQASVAWGRNGTLYYVREGFGKGEGGFSEGHTSIVLARSTDLGDTWKTSIVDNNRGKTGVAALDLGSSIAVDTSGPNDVVYVSFTQYYPDAPADSPLQNGPVVVAVSTDGGANFAPPVSINDFSHITQTIQGKSYPLMMEGFFGAPLLTAHNGVVLAVSGSQNPFNQHPPGDSNFDTRFAYAMPQVVARSTDQGHTWTVATMGPPIFAGAGSQTGLGWTRMGGANGAFVAAYAAAPASSTTSGSADIIFQRSTDGGQTWSDPVAVNDDDPTKQFTNFYPQIGVAPNGRIDVVWQDTRDRSDYTVNVRYSYSHDGGTTWAPNVEVSDRPVNFDLGISFNSDLRQPPGVASANQYAAFGWADTRLANELTQTQDNFGSVAVFSSVPAKTSTALRMLGAVFGGLVIAGSVLLVVMLVRRRGAQGHNA
jgi:Neuraminidase (sialidase)